MIFFSCIILIKWALTKLEFSTSLYIISLLLISFNQSLKLNNFFYKTSLSISDNLSNFVLSSLNLSKSDNNSLIIFYFAVLL